MRLLWFNWLFLSCICIMVTSCTWGPRGGTSWNAGQGSQRALEEGRTLLDRNAPIQALAFLSEAYSKYRDKDILDLYREAARQAQTAGDQAYERKEYAKAGMLYRALQERKMPETDGTAVTRGRDQDYLEEQIGECSTRLAEQGLKKYREQNLTEAIAAWQQVLQFDPGNDQVVKALATASRQRARFQAMN